MKIVDSKVRLGYLSVLVWPAIMTGSLIIYWWLIGPLGMSYEVALQVHFIGLFFCIFMLELIIPYHLSWNTYDRQRWNDILYNVTFPLVQIGAALVALWFTGQQSVSSNKDLLDMSIPFVLQLIILVLFVDFIWYVCHRVFHTLPWLWKMHAMHHNSEQLHVLNNARVHPLELFVFFLPIMLLVQFIEVPLALLNWYFAFQLTVGLLTHSNIIVNSGWLSLVFNTPELHHWHHSKLRKEHDNNYGSVSMVWDHIFGTYYNPLDRIPSEDIGTDTDVPTNWFSQLAIPFLRSSSKNKNITQPK